MNAGNSLWNRFLAAARNERVLLTAQCFGAQSVSGVLLSFDEEALLFSSAGHQTLVPRSAVVSLTPARPLRLEERESRL